MLLANTNEGGSPTLLMLEYGQSDSFSGEWGISCTVKERALNICKIHLLASIRFTVLGAELLHLDDLP